MAIIRLDCNLNGGDSVTPNNELFYRIYGDVDNYASPIHTTGTALSDSNVTVDNDNVIITGVDSGLSSNFKIAAVDGAFNEGILSDAVSGSIVIFGDDFSDSGVSATLWDVTNPSSGSGVTISLIDEMSFTLTAPITTGNSDLVIAKTTYSGFRYFCFDLTHGNQNSNTGIWSAGFRDLLESPQNIIALERPSSNATNVNFGVNINGTKVFDEEFDLDTSTSKTFRMGFNDGGDIALDYWSGSAWIEQFTHTPVGLTTTDWWPRFTFASNGTDEVNIIDNVSITSATFSTRYPI